MEKTKSAQNIQPTYQRRDCDRENKSDPPPGPFPPCTPLHCSDFLVLGGLLDGCLLADDLLEPLQPHVLGGLVSHPRLAAVQQGQGVDVLQLRVLHSLVHHQIQELVGRVVQHLVVLPGKARQRGSLAARSAVDRVSVAMHVLVISYCVYLLSKHLLITGCCSRLPRWLSSNPPAVQEIQETQVRALSWEDPLEEGMATHSSILT